MDSFNRSFNINIQPLEDGVFLVSATMQDHFHNIRLDLKVREEDLTIVEARGTMGWIPYESGCPNSLPTLQRLVGASVQRGITKKIAADLGGAGGCAYFVELAIQAIRFIGVATRVQQARKLILEDEDLIAFKALRAAEMGECTGHSDLTTDQLPQWLERERQRKKEGT